MATATRTKEKSEGLQKKKNSNSSNYCALFPTSSDPALKEKPSKTTALYFLSLKETRGEGAKGEQRVKQSNLSLCFTHPRPAEQTPPGPWGRTTAAPRSRLSARAPPSSPARTIPPRPRRRGVRFRRPSDRARGGASGRASLCRPSSACRRGGRAGAPGEARRGWGPLVGGKKREWYV